MDRTQYNPLVIISGLNGNIRHANGADQLVPSLISKAGNEATKRFIEFFVVTIRNGNTREAYYRACCRFLEWCADCHLSNISSIEPLHVATYIEHLGRNFSRPTVKQHLSAIRILFDWLVIGRTIAGNPATSVRGPKHNVRRGTTPILSPTEIKQLLHSIDTSTTVGLRDRALIALMIFSFARISAALGVCPKDYFITGNRKWICLREKGSNLHEMPVHHMLEEYMDSFIERTHQSRLDNTPIFRTANASGELQPKFMNRFDAHRMIKDRARSAGITTEVSCHSFRASGITIYLSNGGILEKAQSMAGHRSPQTTKIYDRTDDSVTISEVERIQL